MKAKQKPKINTFKRVFSYIAETGSLMFMPRTHVRSLINTFDSVSSHAHHVSIIAYSITRMEGLSHEDRLKAMAMGVLHDNPEARTGDLDFMAKHYGENNEDLAIEHQLKGLPFANDLNNLYKEYIQRDSLIAKCAKDADTVDQIYQEWVLMHAGNKMAEKWFVGNHKDRIPFLRTESAKKIALEMKKTHPHAWWYTQEIEKDKNELAMLNGKK